MVFNIPKTKQKHLTITNYNDVDWVGQLDEKITTRNLVNWN
jgi:hypothetical protein